VSTASIRVRRVGFRFGTDAELAAMHLVESEIESERRPGRAPQPLDSYMAFARSLPSQFDDHTWLAESADGTPVGCSACWSNSAGDPGVMQCYVYVRQPWRTQGIGWRLAEAIIDEAGKEGRQSLVWSTYGSAPEGEAFSVRLGGKVARVNRNSELRMTDLDWELVHSWIENGKRRAAGYVLEFWERPLPDELREDAVRFEQIMQTAPRDDLEVADVLLDDHHIAELDRHLVEAGQQRWTIFVRDADGRCVGGTELTLQPWEPTVAHQENTGIEPAHRGLGLAKWAKASMLARVRDELPALSVIRTGNAFSNGPMLAINDALGFTVVEVRTEWQGDILQLHNAPR
jgi:mycothiol synthase